MTTSVMVDRSIRLFSGGIASIQRDTAPVPSNGMNRSPPKLSSKLPVSLVPCDTAISCVTFQFCRSPAGIVDGALP